MHAALAIAEMCLTSGLVNGQQGGGLRPGVRYRMNRSADDGPRTVVYIGPHARRNGLWSGKVRVMDTVTHRTLVARAQELTNP